MAESPRVMHWLMPWFWASLIAVGSLSWAQENQSIPETPPVAATATESNPDEPPPLREQTIYIPYRRLRDVFEEHGRGVFLPYERFQELWRLARSAEKPPAVERPPVGAVVTEIASEAVVERDVMRVKAALHIELLGKGWQRVPLRLRDSAIRSATIDGQPARLLANPQSGYELLIRNETEGPRRMTLSLEYAKGYTKSPGQNSVSLDAPQAPVNRWQIRIPQAGVKVQVFPLIAATEVPAGALSAAGSGADSGAEEEDDPSPIEAPAGETVVLAFVGAAPEVRFDWTPKAEGAAGLEALATVQSQQELTIDEGVVRLRSRLSYEISRAEISQLVLEAPAEYKVTRVLDPNVRQWSVETSNDRQTITVQLFQPVRGTQDLVVELEKFADVPSLAEVPSPLLQATGVDRQQGLLVVRLGEELRAEPLSKSGLLQVDQTELPSALRASPWAYAYRYAALPYELALKVEKIQPLVQARQLTEVYVEPQALTVDLLAAIDIQRAGLYQLQATVPPDYEIRQVVGLAAGGANPASIDAYRVTEGNVLQIDLAQKALGLTGLRIELRRELDDANLREPTGAASDLVLAIPRVLVPGNRLSGGIVVHAAESLRLNPVATEGLRPVTFAEARQSFESVRQGRFPDAREVLAFIHAAAFQDPTLSAERRRPLITVRQLLHAEIDSGVTKFTATFFVDVQYSGVKTIRIDVPTSISDQVRNRTPQIREAIMAPQPADVGEGFTAWSFTAEREFLGSSVLELGWEQPGDELDIGKSAEITIPMLRPMAVDRAWGQIVLTKGETLDIRPSQPPQSLRPIDPQVDLMPGVSLPQAARAYEFHDAWALTVLATRYELEEVKRTSIERALVRMVVTRSDRIAVQALYRVRSALQRIAVQLPAGSEFDTDPLYVNGQLRGLERGDQGTLFIPLAGQATDRPALVELRYTVPGSQSRLDLPVFPAQEGVATEPAMQKVELSVYLPKELAVLNSRGPWTNQQADWYYRLNGIPTPTDDDHLVSWVVEGLEVDSKRVRSFPKDGRLYAFTTLQPEPPPDGSLRLLAWDTRLLNLVVFGCLALVGLAGAPRSLSFQLTLLATVMIALVLAGIFLPTLAIQILDGNLLVAISLLLLLWLIVDTVRVLPKQPRQAPPPVTVTPREPGTAGRGGATAGGSGGQSPFASNAPSEETRMGDAGGNDSSQEAREGGPKDA